MHFEQLCPAVSGLQQHQHSAFSVTTAIRLVMAPSESRLCISSSCALRFLTCSTTSNLHWHYRNLYGLYAQCMHLCL